MVVIFAIVFVQQLFATFQIPDRLIYNNDTLSFFANPLEALEEMDSLRLKLFGDKNGCLTTACWREYIAEWTIIDNQLYLVAIYSCCYSEDSIKSNLQELFGEKFINGKVKANWVNGSVISSKGKGFLFFYEAFYEKDIVFEFVKGSVKDTKTYDNSKMSVSIYSQDLVLRNFIYTNINWTKLSLEDNPVRVIIRFSGNEEGKIDSIKIEQGFNEVFDNEALRIIKSIPQWSILYKLGAFERREYLIPIVFSEKMKQTYMK